MAAAGPQPKDVEKRRSEIAATAEASRGSGRLAGGFTETDAQRRASPPVLRTTRSPPQENDFVVPMVLSLPSPMILLPMVLPYPGFAGTVSGCFRRRGP